MKTEPGVPAAASRADNCPMTEPQRPYQPSAGAVYAAVGTALVVLGFIALANTDEADMVGAIGVGLVVAGAYCTIAGAVARGIQLARG